MTKTKRASTPRQAQASGARLLTPTEHELMDEMVSFHADELRQLALVLGGMLEHYCPCACGQQNADHDALIVVIPQPYLAVYQKYWPILQSYIEKEVQQETSPAQGVFA